ncbi:HPr(Ser) kinase/phosphatase [Rubricoccus marinus]|uniref:HPr kinase/phosphorylase n=1 Tax=Rubricoccus marinus TaxID=716817 RepID=A0A259TVM4_9BACT|nr:HPr(Ser) kinase/phosphatase [Rubricoccus marinus]OZC01598.1 HPr(Ser) kinase/phosphatase [Rubricoccus marinus]
MRPQQSFRKESITVEYLAERMRERVGAEMEPVNGVDVSARTVTEPSIHRPGLALAGYTELFTHHRVQVLGNTECRYLAWLDDDARMEAFSRLLGFDLPCIVLTDGNTIPDSLRDAATRAGVPLFRTQEATVPFMGRLRDFLEDQFSEQLTLHGSLLDVYGIGLLLTGPAGIGKSEVALDLVERGHRLVADDVVIATKKTEGVLMGAGTDLAQHFMEIRGLGIVDVRAMFGVRAIRHQKRIEVIVRIHPWDESEEYTRIDMVDETDRILSVELPVVKLPIVPGKNVTVICEVIAMNYLLRHYGYDPAEVFKKRLHDQIQRKRDGAPRRGIEWFEHDTE